MEEVTVIVNTLMRANENFEMPEGFEDINFGSNLISCGDHYLITADDAGKVIAGFKTKEPCAYKITFTGLKPHAVFDLEILPGQSFETKKANAAGIVEFRLSLEEKSSFVMKQI